MAQYYKWEKYTVAYTEVTTTSRTFSLTLPNRELYYSTIKNNYGGTYHTSTPLGNGIINSLMTDGGSTFIDGTWYYGDSTTPKSVYSNGGKIQIVGTSVGVNLKAYSGGDITKYTLSEGKGSLVGYVYSLSASAYPQSGVSGGYWYSNWTVVNSPVSPTTITYPSVIIDSTVTVSWNEAYSVVALREYNVQYSVDSGLSWKTAENTLQTSILFSIPTGTTSIMFRVRAVDTNGQAAAYTTGTESQVLLSPTLTVPSLAMQGQGITVNWTAIEGADSYTLQRKANTDADWAQVYSGSATAFSETVGTWTSVQYRVCAVFGSTNGGWAESVAIPVVSASALVISGTDGDLGTIINDIPYSISTDTGNQITATITVNSAVIFSGNVGNSTADTIPVLDLVNGEGTIVIEASVQATSGTVSAVRTWTYTKAPITFPNALAVAQLTRNGVNIAPKTLAECVRLPGGETLDKVMGFPAQVYAGSYVGTGTFGASNPNTLTAPFEIKAVLITGGSGPTLTTALMVKDGPYTMVYIANTPYPVDVSWNGNSVSYTSSKASSQLNYASNNYYYALFG